jgi:hypothetical protein|tara:strand:+ start:510 stop:644 length:135 start_codon:yes stop_codon:yes gene_type:complete
MNGGNGGLVVYQKKNISTYFYFVKPKKRLVLTNALSDKTTKIIS